MIDERRETQASWYVLGSLPTEEIPEFELALKNDRALQALVRELERAAAALTVSFPLKAPPPALRQKLLESLPSRPPTSLAPVPAPDRWAPAINWSPWGLAACFAVLCVALVSIGQSLRQQAVDLAEELGERNTEAVELRRQVDQLEARLQQQTTNYQDRLVEIQKQVAQRVAELGRQSAAFTNQFRQQQAETQRQLGLYREHANQLQREKKLLEEALTGIAPAGSERLAAARLALLRSTSDATRAPIGASIWSPAEQRGLLLVENLPPLPTNQSYQLWLLDSKGGAPVNAGTLPPGASGAVRHSFSTEARIDSVDRFAISIEPRGGSKSPTGRISYASN